ncbi:MAG: 2-amino-4-hydroxy-6-hydroxymethyldihydropteridine diphosphokinase [Epsilonproteobacteria bacterium]|nr:2-amino-4-hydroxy-6-hydroxymethyldihydropteridine diphosphokinase [Campylobacterota bacterium]OIO13435.1 MAG: 2-amino-4-hydroxy-6-hydroxymethyldihydropteridine diphosphokinase [Helicobacteraceae bacterium CG1_02_36_14]PIP09890.1 MAG: 2-amino-4-hydroxy-6-hydroxymethyldihydropteridine diphosphokinase [Sulfurimonas sp. CG23_combo_of_CG06-09_8_20_14_all_36_33]PIS24106.1 MAG: 2-amino-4-hydroxy-6-hydroxymethyldihydropteridine diphosphokinase [Sulfurimonas sp. CG08_land_8_20_14_0_20_36_33]PIU35590.
MYIKRKLNESLTTFKGLHYGYKTFQKSSHRYRVSVGIGGNIGDVKRRFEHLFFVLKRDKRVELLETSLILKNPPFGFKNQDDFFNSIIVLQVSMQPTYFLDYLMRLEKKFARKRSFANAPRTLDLDIIFFDNRVIQTPRLQIPHASWSQRESVVIPLSGLKI